MKGLLIVASIAIACGTALPAAAVQGGTTPPVVTPTGNGPIPKARSAVIDAVLDANDWISCASPFENYSCSTDSFFAKKKK